MEVRAVRFAVPISRRRIRHAQTNVDGRAHQPRRDGLQAGKPCGVMSSMSFGIRPDSQSDATVGEETDQVRGREHVVLGHGNALIKKRWKLRTPPQKRSKPPRFQSIVTLLFILDKMTE